MEYEPLIFLVQDDIFHKAPHKSPFSVIVNIWIFDHVIDGLDAGEHGFFRGLLMGGGCGFQIADLALERITYFAEPFPVLLIFF